MTNIGKWVGKNIEGTLILPGGNVDYRVVVMKTNLGFGGSPKVVVGYWHGGRGCFGIDDIENATHLVNEYFIVPGCD